MTKKKYIDADSVIKDLRRIVAEPWNHNAAPASWAETYEDLIDILESEPAADVRPVKRGEWVGYPECLKYPNAYSNDHIVCSSCEECFSVLDNDTERFDFCPHCGADMRKQDD